jgi:uncharacterized protein
MILKILAVVVVLTLVYLVFFKKNRESEISKKNQRDDKYDQITDTMVECPSCGTYVSKDEAILSNGKYYCSKGCLG